jgi:hypothetical protein
MGQPLRSFGIQTIGSSSQPCFGTTIEAVDSFVVDQFTGNTVPGSNESLSYFQVADVSGFEKGDSVAVGPKTSFEYPTAGSLPAFIDCGTVYAIIAGSPYSILVIQALKNAHASGEYILLNNDAAIVTVIPVSLSAAAYLGTKSTVSSSDISTFDRLPAYAGTGIPYVSEIRSGSQFSPLKTSDWWVTGEQDDTFLARWAEF